MSSLSRRFLVFVYSCRLIFVSSAFAVQLRPYPPLESFSRLHSKYTALSPPSLRFLEKGRDWPQVPPPLRLVLASLEPQHVPERNSQPASLFLSGHRLRRGTPDVAVRALAELSITSMTSRAAPRAVGPLGAVAAGPSGPRRRSPRLMKSAGPTTKKDGQHPSREPPPKKKKEEAAAAMKREKEDKEPGEKAKDPSKQLLTVEVSMELEKFRSGLVPLKKTGTNSRSSNEAHRDPGRIAATTPPPLSALHAPHTARSSRKEREEVGRSLGESPQEDHDTSSRTRFDHADPPSATSSELLLGDSNVLEGEGKPCKGEVDCLRPSGTPPPSTSRAVSACLTVSQVKAEEEEEEGVSTQLVSLSSAHSSGKTAAEEDTEVSVRRGGEERVRHSSFALALSPRKFFLSGPKRQRAAVNVKRMTGTEGSASSSRHKNEMSVEHAEPGGGRAEEDQPCAGRRDIEDLAGIPGRHVAVKTNAKKKKKKASGDAESVLSPLPCPPHFREVWQAIKDMRAKVRDCLSLPQQCSSTS